jgi:hypothetical protein
MYELLAISHSILRWIVVITILTSILYAFYYYFTNSSFKSNLKFVSQVALISLHTQFLLGLILYFISPKVIFNSLAMKLPMNRFFLVEHLFAMIIAITLITIGYAKSKKTRDGSAKIRNILIFYTIGFIIILVAIPWPFYNFGTRWL